jgi:hypothetical protein
MYLVPLVHAETIGATAKRLAGKVTETVAVPSAAKAPVRAVAVPAANA